MDKIEPCLSEELYEEAVKEAFIDGFNACLNYHDTRTAEEAWNEYNS